jgi:L,D-transpeptidase-like protein
MRFSRLGIALGLFALLGLGMASTGGSMEAPDDTALAGVPPGDHARLAGLKARGLKPPPKLQAATRFLIARPRGGSLVLRSAPGGAVVARLGSSTEFGSPLRLGVVRERGRWLGVVSTRLPNGRLGWVRTRDVRLSTTDISLTLDLSKRRLVLKRGDRVVREMVVGVGRPSSPTPRGRFAVTDKLSGYRYSPAYGCCIVALSAHQPNLPAGWTGGDRIAIHGTNNPSSIGVPSSAGCPHASYADMQALMRRVPLGAPVFVRA